mgnify:CR=1 FL=1
MLDERDWLRELITVRSQVGVEVNQTGTVAGTLQDKGLSGYRHGIEISPAWFATARRPSAERIREPRGEPGFGGSLIQEETMRLSEYVEQDTYCRENNVPDGVGCNGCPANGSSDCADALRNLAGKWFSALGTDAWTEINREMERRFGLSPFNQLALTQGILEFPN